MPRKLKTLSKAEANAILKQHGAEIRMGRPLVVGEPRDEFIYFRVTSSERQQIQKQAQAAGLKVAELIRSKLLPDVANTERNGG